MIRFPRLESDVQSIITQIWFSWDCHDTARMGLPFNCLGIYITQLNVISFHYWWMGIYEENCCFVNKTTRCVKESTLESSINLPGPFVLSVTESTLERQWIHYCVTQKLPAGSSQIIPQGLICKTKESSYLFNGREEKQKKHILLTRKLNRMIQDQVIHQARSHFNFYAIFAQNN